jgi:hypothetical protein
MSDFERFGLSGAEPAWSSATLEAAIERALHGSSAEHLIRDVHGRLSARSLSPAHAHFVQEFVKALIRRVDQPIDLGWLARSIDTPAQALLAALLLPEEQLDGEAVLRILSTLERTEVFDEAVVELQDAVVRPEVARLLFAERPELAKRVRAALAH